MHRSISKVHKCTLPRQGPYSACLALSHPVVEQRALRANIHAALQASLKTKRL